ncbi:hypothetical protein ACPPVO_42825 [Dactylosporangium sp. McL0621]|uniref:hypothetical protein n=1 Tax=Dactylosporangium sp. McL0621 TaxID=3415678 RepID=UPI003CE93676
MADNPENATPGTRWLLPPKLPDGLSLNLNSVIGAKRLTPEVTELLMKLLASGDEFSEEGISCIKDPCPNLTSCGVYDAGGQGCGSLGTCGTYQPVIQTVE